MTIDHSTPNDGKNKSLKLWLAHLLASQHKIFHLSDASLAAVTHDRQSQKARHGKATHVCCSYLFRSFPQCRSSIVSILGRAPWPVLFFCGCRPDGNGC